MGKLGTGTAAGASTDCLAENDEAECEGSRDQFVGNTYTGMIDFYRREYAPFIARATEFAAGRGSFVLANQPAGDFSDAAVPDHVFVRTLHRPARATYDFGFGRRRETIKPGSIGFIPAMVATSIVVDDPHNVAIFALPSNIASSDIKKDLSRSLRALDGRMHESQLLSDLLQALLTAAIEGINASLLMVDSLIAAFLAAAIDFADKPQAAASSSRLADWQVRRACALISSRIGEPVTLKEVADEVGLSQFHFSRGFKASTGLAPHQYQLALRVERAKEMLQKTDFSITEIASIVGYDHPGQLSRVFRRSLGTTPTEYRRIIRV